MSHQPERKEKDCLNCGALVQGRYCQRCGQENIITHQGFWSLTKHFVYDIFHFDGKFFDTLKFLFFKPGRVPSEYAQGRRNRYLDPIRMYLFTSAVFFLIFFSAQKVETNFVGSDSRYLTISDRFKEAARLYGTNPAGDSAASQKLALLLDTSITLRADKLNNRNVPDSVTRLVLDNEVFTLYAEPAFSVKNNMDTTAEEWVESRIEPKFNQYKRQYGDDINLMMSDLLNRFFHWFPYILFVSLPIFAFILKLLYRKDKKFVYSDHAVFTLYHYIFSFLLLLLIFGFNALQDATNWGIFGFVSGILIFSWFVYLLFSLRRFYRKGWLNTVFKFLLLNILGFVSFVLIFVVFIFVFIIQL